MFVPVCSLTELPKGTRRVVEVDGRVIAVFHLPDEGLHAIDSVCPHRGGSLGFGELSGALIHCPLHHWCFDVRTGNSPVYTMARVRRHAVRVVNGQVEVETEGVLPPLPEMG